MSLSRMLLSMQSVQGSDEWGQRARINLPPKPIDIEFGARPRERKGREEYVRSSMKTDSFGTSFFDWD
ncbi:hypothetical protein FRC07_011046 [Ceratobasidium sp. 392]|nr:hypothetical protein FRC07_011046 [Ceratobasidium sp. 392]